MTSSASNISVIIPTLNEENEIADCIESLRNRTGNPPAEIIVVDGGSSDRTTKRASEAGTTVLRTDGAGRAPQLNAGARSAKGPIFLFLHADARPPEGYTEYIRQTLRDGYDFGCFAFRFDRSNLLMRINSYLTKFDGLTEGGGDQGLFVRKDLFKTVGGYDESHILMEDFDLYRRLKKRARGIICPHRLTVSARKYRKNGYFRVQCANFLVFGLYHFGVNQSRLASIYQSLLK